jgi:hypothetical protein
MTHIGNDKERNGFLPQTAGMTRMMDAGLHGKDKGGL